MAAKEPTVERRHRELADVAWRRSNDPSGLDFGPEVIAAVIAEVERAASERAWDEGRIAGTNYGLAAANPYRQPKGPTK